jgi:hypothetical protein
VSYGRTTPNGSLPVFSTDTEEEARDLLIFACGTNKHGQFIARELVHEQTLDNLYAFSDRLAEAWKHIEKRKKKAI